MGKRLSSPEVHFFPGSWLSSPKVPVLWFSPLCVISWKLNNSLSCTCSLIIGVIGWRRTWQGQQVGEGGKERKSPVQISDIDNGIWEQLARHGDELWIPEFIALETGVVTDFKDIEYCLKVSSRNGVVFITYRILTYSAFFEDVLPSNSIILY